MDQGAEESELEERTGQDTYNQEGACRLLWAWLLERTRWVFPMSLKVMPLERGLLPSHSLGQRCLWLLMASSRARM